MESDDVDGDPTPSGDREHGRLTGLISDDESGVLGAVLRNSHNLGQKPITNDY